MKFTQRLGYYLGGFSLGLIILAFFLNGKKVSCDYGPEARVLKNINSKILKYNDDIQLKIDNQVIDTIALQHVLKLGDINFSESNTRQKPCGVYIIDGNLNENKITLTIENCDSIATVTNYKIEVID